MKILIAGGCGMGFKFMYSSKKRGFNISSADNLQRNGPNII